MLGVTCPCIHEATEAQTRAALWQWIVNCIYTSFQQVIKVSEKNSMYSKKKNIILTIVCFGNEKRNVEAKPDDGLTQNSE